MWSKDLRNRPLIQAFCCAGVAAESVFPTPLSGKQSVFPTSLSGKQIGLVYSESCSAARATIVRAQHTKQEEFSFSTVEHMPARKFVFRQGGQEWVLGLEIYYPVDCAMSYHLGQTMWNMSL